jgi:hypothetical protein
MNAALARLDDILVDDIDDWPWTRVAVPEELVFCVSFLD